MPLGTGYISASLKAAGHEVHILNPNHSVQKFAEMIESELLQMKPDIVATGGMAFHYAQVKYITTLSKTLLPDTITVIGGPLVSCQPETILQGIQNADYGVVGEAEHTMVELATCIEQHQDFAKVDGIVYRSQGTDSVVIKTNPRAFETNLDSLAFCDYEALGLDIYSRLHKPGECAPALIVDSTTRVMPLLTSRGCPFTCTFCCHESNGKRYRLRSLDSVFREIQDAIDRFEINALFIYDDLFCLNLSRLDEFCRRIKPLNLRWECSMVAGQINPEVLSMMKNSGCCCLSIGVESMSQTVLTSMQKKATRDELETILPMIYEAKLGLWSNLIFGDPAETLETVTESLEWYSTHPQYNLRSANIGYHPGSRIYDEAVNRGLIGDPITYLEANQCEINGTSLSDADLMIAQILIDRALASFGYAGRLLSLDQTDKHETIATCECPHCGEKGVCYTIHRLLASINCPSCNRAYRVPLLVRYKAPQAVLALVEKAKQLEEDNATVEALTAECHKILLQDPCNLYMWSLLIRCADKVGDKVKSAGILEQQIVLDAYNPALFESMANRLDVLGYPVPAQKYRQKADHLNRIGVLGTSIIEVPLPENKVQHAVKSQLEVVMKSLPIASFLIGQGN